MPPWAKGSRTSPARKPPDTLMAHFFTLSCSMLTTRGSEYHERSIVVTPFRLKYSPPLAAITDNGIAKNLTDTRHCDNHNNIEPAGAYMFLMFVLMIVACSLTSTMFPRVKAARSAQKEDSPDTSVRAE